MSQALNQHPKAIAHAQRGSTLLGMVLGIFLGLGIALAVAVYMMKVPTPFNSKTAQRTPAQDAAEIKKNKDWDPNASLLHKATEQASKPNDTNSSSTSAQAANPPAAPSVNPVAEQKANDKSPAGSTTAPSAEYFVQVAAFRNQADANALRAKLALAGFTANVFEREQAGAKLFRVRVGPLASQAVSEKTKATLEAAGFEADITR